MREHCLMEFDFHDAYLRYWFNRITKKRKKKGRKKKEKKRTIKIWI